jgi:hypothetical protein
MAAEGAAVVIAADLAPDGRLPTIDALRKDSAGVARAFEEKGLRVVFDPTGKCLAVTAAPHVSDKDLLTVDLPDAVLAAGIAERVTREQLAARKKGYFPAEALSKEQMAAARRFARRFGMVNEQGEPTQPGTHLAIGIWQTWTPHIAVLRDGSTKVHRLMFGIRPPTPLALEEAPLRGSVLWWAWPYAQADWGGKRVSLPPGTYKMPALLNRLSEAGELEIRADGQALGKRFAVVASDVPVRTLLWAMCIAGGLQARVSGDPSSPKVALTTDISREEAYRPQANILGPIPGLGYFSAADSPVCRELLALLQDGRQGQNWIGWRMSDLPLLYRNEIGEHWQITQKLSRSTPPPASSPEDTLVLWTKAILVSVVSRFEDGTCGGPEFPLPTF